MLRRTQAAAVLIASLATLITRCNGAYTLQPIPCGADAYTEAKFSKDLLEYKLRAVKAYDEHTTDPVELRPAARELIESRQRLALKTGEDDPSRQKLQEQARALLDKGSNDPVFLMLAAELSPWRTAEAETVALLDRATSAMAKSTYPARQHAELALRNYAIRFAIAKQRGRKNRKLPDAKPALDAIGTWLAEENDKADQRSIWHVLLNLSVNFSDDSWKQLADGASQNAKIDPWMSNMLAGKALAAAWPYVDTPEGKNSDETLNKLREAGQHFLTAWKYNPIFPEAAAELIKSAREHLTDASPRYWFDQSVSAQFDYLPAYKNFLSCLLPEHGGSRDAMIAFGKECALTDRYDTEVPLQLIEALRQIDKEELDDNFWRQPDLYQAACGVLEKAASVDGAPKERRSALIATRIVIALRADRFDGIAPLLSQTTDEDLRVAMSKHRYSMALGMLRSKAALAAAGVDLAGIQTELHQANASGTAAAAIARIDDELAKVPADVDRAWLHYWRSALPHMEDFHAGKWVNVSQCEEFPRLMDATHWEVKDHTTFVCHSTEFLPFNWLAYFRTPLECTFDVQVNEVPAETILSGLVVGQRAGPGWPSGRIFGINAVKNKVGYDRITANDPKYFPVKLLDVNHFHVRAWPEYFELFVNDERVAAQHDPSFTPYQSLGFWTEVTKDGDVDAIYSNFRIRRISIEPPPADDSAGERMAYFTTQVKNEPDNPYHLIDRGDLHLAARHLDHAIEDFKQAATIRQNWALPEAKIGMAEAAAGKYREALAAYQRALAIDGDCTIALDRLAWLEATCPDASFRSGAKAGQHAKLANDLTSGTSGAYQLTVSAAYAEQGKFKEANTEFQRATRSTKTENFSALEKALQDSYKQRKPYRYTSAVAVDAKGK